MQLLKLKTLIMAGFFLLLAAGAVFANEQSDYSYQYEKYSQKYQEFINLKDAYLNYQTLSYKDQMNISLQSLLAQRAETQRTYFLLLRIKLRNNPGLTASEKSAYSNYLTEEIIYLENYKKKVVELKLPIVLDLSLLSKEFEAKSGEYTIKSYTILSYLLLGNMRDVQSDCVSINSLLDQEIGRYEGQQGDYYHSWVLEAKNTVLESQKLSEEAQTSIIELSAKGKSEEAQNVYKAIQGKITDSKLAIDKAFSYQTELLAKMDKGVLQ